MARSHAARQLRRAARASFVAALGGFCAALPLLSGTAEAQPGSQPPSEPLALSVMSLSPAYAENGQTITITGQIRNLASTAATGLSVQLMASRTPLGTRLDLRSFAAGNDGSALGLTQVGVPPVLIQSLSSGQSWRFTVRLPVSKLGLSCFGVYPLAVQVTDAALDVAQDPVPLPYWPPKATSCTGQRRPQPFPVSWVWPLIDTPHQNVCAGMTDNALAARIAPNGRLSYLLAVGARYASRVRLTWAVDPSLLEGVHAMTRPYQVGATGCRHGAGQPADPNAARWLANLRKATAGQPLFLTPYADVNVAALIRRGNTSDMHLAFTAADQVGHQILHRSLTPAPVPAGPRQFSAIAWPASGIADELVLTNLATQHIDTVILTAPAVPPVSYTPGAVSSKQTGIGKSLHVLLADEPITALLGSHAAASAKPGDVFQTSQRYLAETAMIVSEQPSNRRPIMIAPPRRWDPSRELATNLLADTVAAPWLQPSTTGQMVAEPARHVYPKVTQNPSPVELPATLLRDVSRLDHHIALLQSIRVKPDPGLNRAVFAIESSAWHGRGLKHARSLLEQTSDYVNDQLHGITIRGGGGRHNAYRVTFGGKNAQVPLSIHSNLRYEVKIALRVQANHAKVTGVPKFIVVPPLGYAPAVKLNVHVNAAHGRIRLSLVAPPSSRLAGHSLPAFPLVILVHPTDFGTLALVLFAAALALFVIASAARAIKNGRPEPPEEVNGPGAPTQPPAPGEHARTAPTDETVHSSTEPDDAAAPVPTDVSAGTRQATDRSVVPEKSSAPLGPPARDHTGRPTGGTSDGAARRPSPSGWIAPPDGPAECDTREGIGPQGFLNPDIRPEYADSVGNDRSELTSAGPSVADPEARRTTEERR